MMAQVESLADLEKKLVAARAKAAADPRNEEVRQLTEEIVPLKQRGKDPGKLASFEAQRAALQKAIWGEVKDLAGKCRVAAAGERRARIEKLMESNSKLTDAELKEKSSVLGKQRQALREEHRVIEGIRSDRTLQAAMTELAAKLSPDERARLLKALQSGTGTKADS